MPPVALIIAQYALQYGIPAALEIVKLFQKKEITLADWEAAFAKAETPYGLTPQLINPGITDEGVIIGTSEDPPSADIPPEFQGTPRIIVKISTNSQGTLICNAAGNCWQIYSDSAVTKTVSTTPPGEIWTVGTLRFWVTPKALGK